MKKLIAGLTSAVVLSSLMLVPGASAAPKQQVVEGTILLPAFFAHGSPAFSACWGGLTRRLTQPTGESGSPANGIFGYRFVVDKATWNKPFVLEVTGGEGTVDLDLYLYSVMPPPEDTANDPVNGGTPVSVDFINREEGGESGIVPKGTVEGIACIYGGDTYYGYNASFKYTAGKGVKLPKS